MARYIDADALLQRLPDDLPYKGSVKRVLIQAPTADVVPITEIADFIWQGESEKMNFPFDNRYYNKQEFIAELKKKYTEANNAEKNTDL